MRKIMFACMLVLGMVLSWHAVFADFYVIPAGVRIGTCIDSLPYTISSPGFYFIKKDLTYPSTSGYAITVNADNVTIDLMGFSLIGQGKTSGTSEGIYMDGRKNVEIRNGTVRQFGGRGIDEADSTGSNHRIVNVRVVQNGGLGIHLGGQGHLIKNCTAYDNYSGIDCVRGCIVVENTAYDNDVDGISTGTGCTMIGNAAYRNERWGIEAGPGATVKGNTAALNRDTGIKVSYGSTVIGNTAYDNQNDGIEVDEGCSVISNTAYRNDRFGINLDYRHTVYHNTAYDNDVGNYTGCASDCTVGENYMP